MGFVEPPEDTGEVSMGANVCVEVTKVTLVDGNTALSDALVNCICTIHVPSGKAELGETDVKFELEVAVIGLNTKLPDDAIEESVNVHVLPAVDSVPDL